MDNREQTPAADTRTTRSDRPRARGRLRWLLLAVPLAVAGLVGAQAHAGGRGHHRMHDMDEGERQAMMEKRLDKMLNRLDATDDQRSRIKKIMEASRPKMRALHEERKQLRKKFTAALAADPLNPSEIESLRQRSVALVDRGSKLFGQSAVEVAGVLTPAQRQKIAQFLDRRGAHGPGMF